MSEALSNFSVEVLPANRLPEIERQWELLAANAAEPNPFFEPWMLIPALEALGNRSDCRFALVWRVGAPRPQTGPILAGFFPFITKPRVKGLPISVAEILHHEYCFLGVPLLHKEFSRSVLDAYIDWSGTCTAGSGLTFFRCLPTDGEFHQHLVDALFSRSLFSYIERRYTRAFYRCPADPGGYIAGQFSGKSLKHFRRQKELLAEQGLLEFRRLAPQGDVASWVEAFLRLEASGWKGEAGTALGVLGSHKIFFERVTRLAHERNRLNLSGLWLGENLVAGRTAFRAADGSYLFKIAYDEAYAKYSPGILLELECILNNVGNECVWEDSCTAADNLAYKRLWTRRRTIEDIFVSTGSLKNDLVLSILPSLRFIKSRLRQLGNRFAPPKHAPARK